MTITKGSQAFLDEEHQKIGLQQMERAAHVVPSTLPQSPVATVIFRPVIHADLLNEHHQ